MRRRVLIQALAADPADDVAEQEEVDVAVDHPLVGGRSRHFFGSAANGFVGAGELDFEFEVGAQS